MTYKQKGNLLENLPPDEDTKKLDSYDALKEGLIRKVLEP
jgi:hypothetical protein